MLAVQAMFFRSAIYTDRKKAMRISDFVNWASGGGNRAGLKSARDMSDDERDALKERLKKAKAFFDAHPHPDILTG
jgi:hypothetical protein